MIGILLAGGSGTRLSPITKIVSKHILPVFDRPLIFYPLQTLINSSITKIVVVCGNPFEKQIKTIVEHFPDINKFVSGRIKKISCSYVNQPRPLGMADAIKRCEKIVGTDSIMVIAGDNIYEQAFREEVINFKGGAMSFLRKVKDPSRFAVPVHERNRLIKIEEKPVNPQTNWVVTGPHFYDSAVFKLIDTLKPSARNELEITDLNNRYIEQGLLTLKKRRDWWIDAGTFDALLLASIKIKRKMSKKTS